MFLSSTAATEAAFDIKSIKELMDGLDPAALLPEIGSIVGKVQLVCSIAILIAPVIMLLMGLAYLLFAPKEANYYFGYRTAFGMGSVSAWRHTQKVAGWMFAGVGLVLTVIMLMVCVTFGGLEPMPAVWRAAKCMIAEAVIALIVVLSINSVAAFTYDYKGNKRKK